MKLIRTNVKYYDNALATPMLICLPAGSFMIAIGFGTNSGVCVIIGLILLALFVILKIANWAFAKSKRNDALNNVKIELKNIHNNMVKEGISSNVAKMYILKNLMDRYEKGDLDASIFTKLSKYVSKEI